MPKLVYERAKSLLEAEMGDELVALDAAGGTCFGFNDVAATVWRLLEQPRTVADITQSLMSQFEVDPAQCEMEVGDLLEDLAGRGLVRSRPMSA
jgi:hypothetical protein